MQYPNRILHWLDNSEESNGENVRFSKNSPATGECLTTVLSGNFKCVNRAVDSAKAAFSEWAYFNIIERANLLRRTTQLLEERRDEIVEILHLETGKSKKNCYGEVSASIELGYFMAGEGRRYYGRTTTSAVHNRTAYTIRQPVGVCALIVPFNNPLAAVAYKVFPALLCGNTVVLKAHEDTPYTPVWFAKLLHTAGLPKGVFSVLQGTGEGVGAPLAAHPDVDLVSFTGSVKTGQSILRATADRMAKVCIESGGKNALVVCDDADLEWAAECAVQSAFVDAGQRCAAGSRIVVFDSVYSRFRKILLDKTKALRVGSLESDDVGPIINKLQFDRLLNIIELAKRQRGISVNGDGYCSVYSVSCGNSEGGYYLMPTILEGVSPDNPVSQDELFGPITCLYCVKDFNEALALVNNSKFGLTAAIHTKNIHREKVFIERVRTGVVSVNGHTYGSEPHMPFGGLGLSGNGWREPGTEALDVYSEWKTIYERFDPKLV